MFLFDLGGSRFAFFSRGAYRCVGVRFRIFYLLVCGKSGFAYGCVRGVSRFFFFFRRLSFCFFDRSDDILGQSVHLRSIASGARDLRTRARYNLK